MNETPYRQRNKTPEEIMELILDEISRRRIARRVFAEKLVARACVASVVVSTIVWVLLR